jgi:hypothetical protein
MVFRQEAPFFEGCKMTAAPHRSPPLRRRRSARLTGARRARATFAPLNVPNALATRSPRLRTCDYPFEWAAAKVAGD